MKRRSRGRIRSRRRRVGARRRSEKEEGKGGVEEGKGVEGEVSEEKLGGEEEMKKQGAANINLQCSQDEGRRRRKSKKL